MIPPPKTLAEFLRMAKTASAVTIFWDCRVDFTVDDYENDHRICVRLDRDHRLIEAAHLSGYDAKSHCWRKEVGSSRTTLPSKRGSKAIVDWATALNEDWYGCKRPRMACYYWRNNRLEASRRY